MAVVQFTSLNGDFSATLTDPSGTPSDVLDIDLTFTVSGKILLPTFLTGDGIVTLYADELGGPFDKSIGQQNVPLTGVSSPGDPAGLASYPWSITVGPPTIPDPAPNSNIFRIAASFMYQNPPGNHTDVGALVDLGLFFVV